jgi:hypothetical protein
VENSAQVYPAAHFLNWPFLCYAAEKSASWQHCFPSCESQQFFSACFAKHQLKILVLLLLPLTHIFQTQCGLDKGGGRTFFK